VRAFIGLLPSEELALSASATRHGVDHKLVTLGCVNDHQLEQVSRLIGTDHEVAQGILAEFYPRNGIRVGMSHIRLGDPMTPGRGTDFHTQ
jgi:hypothetical protein